ncbi:MAG: hypothetical protein EPO24_06845 [Bacteroidetes bacterium]|nr:MAG: hypothetical protein EPO24_06845 [Bacteroidota bacterium]
MFSVELAYNSTDSIPAVGAQRKTYSVAYANDMKAKREGESATLGNHHFKIDLLGRKLRILIHFGAGILASSTERTWLYSFLTAKHRWIVYGTFLDTGNSGNLCKCEPLDEEIEVSVPYDRDNGYEFESVKVF